MVISVNSRLDFLQAGVCHLSSTNSDHIPIFLNLLFYHPSSHKRFHFFVIWMRNPSCVTFIWDAWHVEDGMGGKDVSMRRKIFNIIKSPKTWSRDVFDWCQTKIKELEDRISTLQSLSLLKKNLLQK